MLKDAFQNVHTNRRDISFGVVGFKVQDKEIRMIVFFDPTGNPGKMIPRFSFSPAGFVSQPVIGIIFKIEAKTTKVCFCRLNLF